MLASFTRRRPAVHARLDLKDVIAKAFPTLSPKQQRVARFIAANEAITAFTSATELAARIGVDPATVVRLAKALGFRGYPDLQRQLRARFPHHYPSFSHAQDGWDHASDMPGSPLDAVARAFAQDHENLRQALDLLDGPTFAAVVEAIQRARRIVVVGAGVGTGLVHLLASSLTSMGYPAHGVAAEGLAVIQELLVLAPPGPAEADRGDLLVAVGFYRYVRDTVRALERARDLGLLRVALTDSPLSPLVPLADHALCAPVESISHRVSLVAPLAVVNALVAACAASDADRVAAHLRRLDEQYRAGSLLVYE